MKNDNGLSSSSQAKLYENVTSYNANIIGGVVYGYVKKYLKGCILDIGAADGFFLNLLIKNGHSSVFGIDLCPKHPLVVKGGISDIGRIYNQFKFDSVILMDVLEHINYDDYFAALDSISNAVKPGGYLIITTNNNENFQSAIITCPDCGLRFHRAGHCRSLNPDIILNGFLEFKVVMEVVANFGFMATIPVAKWFYYLHINRFFDSYRLNSDLLMVLRKNKEDKRWVTP